MTRASLVTKTFGEFGAQRVQSLCSAVGLSHRRAEAAALFEELVHPWGDLPIGEVPRWASDITDDHSPLELSLALHEGAPELRMLVEAQAPEPSLTTNWEAAWELSLALERDHGACLDRLRRVRDLYEPTDPSAQSWARFSMWHAVCLGAEGAPEFKVYLNPQVRGPEHAAGVVKETLIRLGLSSAWTSIRELVSSLDELKYISLDLSSRKQARVKVYLAHHHVTAKRLEAVMSASRDHVAGDAVDVCRALGGSEGPFSSLPAYTCLAFVEGGDRPSAVTLYFPIRSYANDDRVACDRILSLLPERDRPIYQRAIRAAASRPLDEGVGMQTYASFRRQGGNPRVTVYFSPEAYEVKPAAGFFAAAPEAAKRRARGGVVPAALEARVLDTQGGDAPVSGLRVSAEVAFQRKVG